MISFIVPAHNEQALIGRTLSALHESAAALGEAYEIVVANDASTDRTADVALDHGARVVPLDRRQIAASRNAGACEAKGELFIFVDADTIVTARALSAALRALRGGAAGGGCTVRLDGRLPFYAVILMRLLPPLLRFFGLAPGCFLFCTRRAYFAVGGFDESFFAGEEVAFSQRLRRQGRVVILREEVISSGRKLRTRTALQFLGVAARLALRGPKSLRRREGLDFWYGPREA